MKPGKIGSEFCHKGGTLVSNDDQLGSGYLFRRWNPDGDRTDEIQGFSASFALFSWHVYILKRR